MHLIESTTNRAGEPHERTCAHALAALNARGPRFMLGGAFALTHYTEVIRSTKDIDLFVTAEDVPATLRCLEIIGFRTQLTFPHWLAKAQLGPLKFDVIFASGNGVARVDAEWFQYATDTSLYGVPVRVVPVEELIWSKAYVMERERYDGADVAHLLRARGRSLDWARLERRFGPHRAVLLSYILLFEFIYSDARRYLPEGVFERLVDAVRAQRATQHEPDERVCRGALLSRQQFLSDILDTGYADGRIVEGAMTPDQVELWTAAIDTAS